MITDIENLWLVANKANHGHAGRSWEWSGGYPQTIKRVGDAALIANTYESPDFPSTIAEFIATFDPPTVLALLREVARAGATIAFGADTTIKTRIAKIIRFDAAFDDLSEAQSESVAEKVIAEAACWPINVDANADQYNRALERRYMTDDVFHARVYAAARTIESGGPWPTAEDAAMAILDAAERQVPTVDSAYHDERMDVALKRAIRAEVALERLKDPDPLVLNAATEASLRGVALAPVPIEHAIEDPRNREAIRRALKAAADKVTE